MSAPKVNKAKTAKSDMQPRTAASKREGVEPTVPLNIALHRVMASVGDDLQLAEHRLNRDLRSGRLEAEVVQLSPDKETRTLLKRANWRQWTVRLQQDYTPSGLGTIVARVFDKDNKPVSGVFFVLRPGLDKHYPRELPAAAPRDEPRHTPGPKPTDDWPKELAAELIRIAVADPTALQNVDKLVRNIQTDFADTGRFLPQDPKRVRQEILLLLKRIR